MDTKGYEGIVAALAEDWNSTVIPEPKPGENVRFVTIETAPDVQPALILNALHKADLMIRDRGMQYTVRRTPELEPISVQGGAITFEDKNNQK